MLLGLDDNFNKFSNGFGFATLNLDVIADKSVVVPFEFTPVLFSWLVFVRGGLGIGTILPLRLCFISLFKALQLSFVVCFFACDASECVLSSLICGSFDETSNLAIC